jgi:rhamnosyl/mannosyltransferase
MKVLHIGKFYPPVAGGMENFLADLVEAQRRAGLDSRVICHQYKGEPLNQGKRSSFVRRVRTFGSLCYVPVCPAFPVVLYQEIKKFQPDVIHVHMPNFSGFFIPPCYKGKIVVHWHSDVVFPQEKIFHRFLYQIYRLPERRLLSRADAVIATSPPYLEESPALCDFQEKSVVIPLGLGDHRVFLCNESEKQKVRLQYAPLAPQGRLLVTVGRLSHYKGLQHLLKAMQGTSSRLLIIGTGEQRLLLEKMAKELGLSKQVTFLGYVQDELMNKIVAAADMCCLPSTDRSEAFGLILLEAMALGTACLSTAIVGSGTGWANKDGLTGAVVPPASVEALHHVICAAERGALDTKELGRNARLFFEQNYRMETIETRIRELYSKI